MLKQQAAKLPTEAGVYLFKDKEGQVLYVGKAKNLRDRVHSYFAKDLNRGPGIDKMMTLATMIDYRVADSEIAAILLEARAIRELKPPFNIRLRDDKSFSVIKIDPTEEYPGVYLMREKDVETLLEKRNRSRKNAIKQKIDNQEFYGPYISSAALKESLRIIRRLWPFRDCSEAKYRRYAQLGRGCLYASLNLCQAPCANINLKKEEYLSNIEQVRMLLRGDQGKLIKMIEQEMFAAAEVQNFERAKVLRDRLQALEHVHTMAKVSRVAQEISLEAPDSDMVRDMNSSYLRPGEDGENDLVIEAYDISNNQGGYAVGGGVKVRLLDGKKAMVKDRLVLKSILRWEKRGYRRFKIKWVEGVSDVDMLAEVIFRRLKRSVKEPEKWALPDYILLDGGLAQLNKIKAVFNVNPEIVSQGLGVGLLAVAKGKTRKKVDLYGEDWEKLENMTVEVKKNLAELMREEAHRFAIKFYREKHRKGMFK